MSNPFQGFVWPKENWYRLPDQWIEITRNIHSIATLKVVEYILRHTWGYVGQSTKPKRISINEFCKGRRKKGGGRIDLGTGLCEASVRKGLREALEMGLIEVIKEESDPARIKHYYLLKMQSAGEGDTPREPPIESIPGASKVYYTPLQKIGGPPLESIPRSTIDNLKKDNPNGSGATGNGRPPARDGLLVSGYRKKRRTAPHLTEFDKTAGGHLKNLLSDCESDLAQAKVESFAEAVYKLRTVRKVDQDRIRGIIRWLKHHYNDPYTPKLRKCDDFCNNFRRIEEAKERQELDQEREKDGQEEKPTERHQLHERVSNWLWEAGMVDDRNTFVTQEELDKLLVEKGMTAGSVKYQDVGY